MVYDKNYPISSYQYGRLFLEKLHEEIELMQEIKSPHNCDCWRSDDRYWFDACFPPLLAGAKNEEPALLYLLAEFMNYHLLGLCSNPPLGFCDFELWELLNDGDIIDGPYSEESYEESFQELMVFLYCKAAEMGFPQALLRCAYSFENGKGSFPCDPVKAEEFLEEVREPLKTLNLTELDFLEKEFEMLIEHAYDADTLEDTIVSLSSEDDYEDNLPDPTWRTLHLRSISMAFFMLSMGLTYVTEQQGFEYRWPYDFNSNGQGLKTEKEKWENWCRQKGKIR